MSLVRGDWWAAGSGTRPILKDMADVDPADLNSCCVTLYRSVMLYTPDLAVKTSLTSCYVAFRPPVALTVKRLQLIPLDAMTMATCAVNKWIVYNSSAELATLTMTTNLSQGVPVDMGTITNAVVAACSDITIKVASTCTDAPACLYQLDYLTTG